MIAYKFLRGDGTSAFTAFRWPLPAGDAPGAWVRAAVDPCRSGVHACRPADVPYWVGATLYEIELDGPVTVADTKVVAPAARLTRRIGAWEDGVRDAYARMCADRARELAGPAGLDAWTVSLAGAGAAASGFIAARIAEELGGGAAWDAERARQAAWLADRLGLAGARTGRNGARGRRTGA